MKRNLPGIGFALVIGLASGAAAAPPTCNGLPLIGTPEEIASTPRADTNLESLSVEMTGRLTADQEVYDRVTADIALIRSLFPETADVPYRGRVEGRLLTLQVDEDTGAAMESGAYTAWDCLNDYYGLESVERESFLFLDIVTLRFKGIYFMSFLEPLYAQLPEVNHASAQPGGLDRSICGLVDSRSTHHYFIVVEAFGDCLAGCIFKDVRYFTSRAGGVPRFRGKYFNFEGGPPPPWAEVHPECVFDTLDPLPARIGVVPDPAVPEEAVVLTISGDDGDSVCGPFVDDVEIDSANKAIRVTADFNAECGPCSPEASPYSFDVDLGPLPEGEYLVKYFVRTRRLVGDDCSFHQGLHGLTELVVGGPPIAPIPVLDHAGLATLAILVLAVALFLLRRARGGFKIAG